MDNSIERRAELMIDSGEIGPNRQIAERRVSVCRYHRDIDRVATATDHNAASSTVIIPGVKGPPAVP